MPWKKMSDFYSMIIKPYAMHVLWPHTVNSQDNFPFSFTYLKFPKRNWLQLVIFLSFLLFFWSKRGFVLDSFIDIWGRQNKAKGTFAWISFTWNRIGCLLKWPEKSSTTIAAMKNVQRKIWNYCPEAPLWIPLKRKRDLFIYLLFQGLKSYTIQLFP